MFDDLIDRLSDLISSAAESASDAFSGLVGDFFGGGDEPPDEPPAGSDFDEPDDSDINAFMQQSLEDNIHPSELSDVLDSNQLDQYTDMLIDKLDLNGDWDDSNHTERSVYATYEDLINYLETFNGGYPDDDLIEIELTDEGFQLYVAIDTP